MSTSSRSLHRLMVGMVLSVALYAVGDGGVPATVAALSAFITGIWEVPRGWGPLRSVIVELLLSRDINILIKWSQRIYEVSNILGICHCLYDLLGQRGRKMSVAREGHKNREKVHEGWGVEEWTQGIDCEWYEWMKDGSQKSEGGRDWGGLMMNGMVKRSKEKNTGE